MSTVELQLLWWAVILIGFGTLALALVYRYERRTFVEHSQRCLASSTGD